MTTCFIAFILAMLVLSVSWIAICGLIFLITLCFGLEFSWLLSTLVWVGIVIVAFIFWGNVTVFDSRD